MTKISGYPVESTPSLTDELVSNEGGTVTSRVPIGDYVDLHRGPKNFQGTAAQYSGDTTGGTSASVSTTSHANVTHWVPLFIPEPRTLTLIECRCSTLEVGAIARFGLYLITSIGTVPVGDLVADFGTVDASTTGVKSISVSQAVEKGLYALCAAASNHSTVRYRRYEDIANFFIYGEVSVGSLTPVQGWWDLSTDYSGGLPATITASAPFPGASNGTIDIQATFT